MAMSALAEFRKGNKAGKPVWKQSLYVTAMRAAYIHLSGEQPTSNLRKDELIRRLEPLFADANEIVVPPKEAEEVIPTPRPVANATTRSGRLTMPNSRFA